MSFRRYRLKIYKPYLEAYIRLPLLTVWVGLMVKRIERDAFEYVGLQITLWKYNWNFRLYKPGKDYV